MAEIMIDDDRYWKEYKPLTFELARSFLESKLKRYWYGFDTLMDKMSAMLRELGWPKALTRDKIIADVRLLGVDISLII